MTYAPFTRGPFPAGVRSLTLLDGERDRRLEVEIWYPASDGHAGDDLSPRTRDRYAVIPGFPATSQDAVRDADPRRGRFPLVVFSHGWSGHRRQSTFLCTHLASHGFIVAAADHAGTTMTDVLQLRLVARRVGNAASDDGEMVASSHDALGLTERPADLIFLIDRAVNGGLGEVSACVDPDRVGVTGHSIGGWTALVAAEREPRIGAVLALAPAGGPGPFPSVRLAEALRFDWGREVPTMFLAAGDDSILPLAGVVEVFARIDSPKKMIVLRDADHFHFLDRAGEIHELMRTGALRPFDRIAASMRPIAEMCGEELSSIAIAGLGVAHMDAVLNGRDEARAFIDDGAQATLRARGLTVTVM